MKRILISCGAVSLLLLAGCGKSDQAESVKPKEEPTKTAAGAPAAVDDANAGSVTGKVSFSGEKPVMKNISMDATPACAKAHTTPQKSQEVVVNDNGTLRNTFVWVKAGLADTLSNSGPYTVFAPTDAAFAKVPKKTLTALGKNKKALKQVLLYHVVKGSVPAKKVVKLKSAKTVEGSKVRIKVRKGNVYLNRTTKVTAVDVRASNGIIHVINKVLIPKDLHL